MFVVAAAARMKAEAVDKKIGYPPYIVDDTLLADHYAGLVVLPHGYLANQMS